jgi:hypothetical protein
MGVEDLQPRRLSEEPELQSDLLRVLIQIQGGRRLTREQFYLAMAFGLLNFSNRSTGVYQFDDYEIFDFFCYEDQEQCGYIQPSLEPNPPPVQGTEITLTARTGPGLAPEDVFWHRLRSAQRLFFESYLSEVAIRFKRD